MALIFIFQNRETISVDLFRLNVQAPLWLLLLVILAVGYLLGLLTRYGRKSPSGPGPR